MLNEICREHDVKAKIYIDSDSKQASIAPCEECEDNLEIVNLFPLELGSVYEDDEYDDDEDYDDYDDDEDYYDDDEDYYDDDEDDEDYEDDDENEDY